MPLLFSYGTLQDEAVQLSLFGRRLQGERDELVGYEQSWLTLERDRYRIVKRSDRRDSRVTGVVFEVSDSELAKADTYEPPPYVRVRAALASGKEAWLYAESEAPPNLPRGEFR
jgi:gamma-glutamylcyclotransferase (GGCT)/AIG2-like uncharacterized protein YtfP